MSWEKGERERVAKELMPGQRQKEEEEERVGWGAMLLFPSVREISRDASQTEAETRARSRRGNCRVFLGVAVLV